MLDQRQSISAGYAAIAAFGGSQENRRDLQHGVWFECEHDRLAFISNDRLRTTL